MQETVSSRQQSKTTVPETTNTTVAAEVDKVIVVSIAVFASLVGIWSAACLISAMIQAGGPLQLVGGWFKAVSGM